MKMVLSVLYRKENLVLRVVAHVHNPSTQQGRGEGTQVPGQVGLQCKPVSVTLLWL